MTSRFIAQMEMILWLYAQPHDPLYPVICLDERPCFLIGDVVEPLAMQTGQIRKEHYAYAKLGSCALFAAIEPLTGNRIAQIHDQRTKKRVCVVLSGGGGRLPGSRQSPSRPG
jgi:hypothetical protein